MIVKDQYLKIVNSDEFIRKQLTFQKQIYVKINKQCNKASVISQGKYKQCYKRETEKIKKFALFTQLLIEKRQEMLKEIVRLKCGEKLNNIGEFFPCLDQQQLSFIGKYKRKDTQYLNILRDELLTK